MSEILIPNNSTYDVASFTITVDGTAIAPTFQLQSLTIVLETNRIPQAKMVFRDGNAADQTFAASDGNSFAPGKPIVISLGRDSTNKEVFEGIIIRHAIKVKNGGAGELLIECRHNAVRMSIGRHSRYYNNLKDSDLFNQLASNYKLQLQSEKTVLQHKEIVQHHITDWDFLLLRAEANGMLVNIDGAQINIGKPNTNTSPALQVNYGSSILEFEAEMDVRNQWKSVKTASWDHSNQALFQASSTSSSLTEPGNIPASDLAKAIDVDYEMHHSGHLLQQELQSLADGAFMRSRLAKIKGRAKVLGFSGIKPGDMLKISGTGARFNGNAYVSGVRHDVGLGAWETHIQFGFHSSYHTQEHDDIQNMQAEGLVGSINGLQIGKVIQLESDPDGENRILVKIPTIDNAGRGIWTRVATLDAGKDRGSFFLPEIDDEVIVGFINDDPRHAVTLGMLNSSAKPAPIKAQDANDKKGITTRSKMHISFDDNTKTITIDTPAGNSITLDESGQKIEIKDQNSNKVTMDTSGITLDSPKDVKVKAGTNLTLSAVSSLSLSAASISVKADADVSVQGATAAVSSQGITEVKGSLVKIN
ncbi:type VI secretion system tip protein VgrG [Chitinophagaceae bacterium 26-R-25]|nr:type VI secretion system tip protein VgrG [Chitinophagaceae bacterium 26-R-25]